MPLDTAKLPEPAASIRVFAKKHPVVRVHRWLRLRYLRDLREYRGQQWWKWQW